MILDPISALSLSLLVCTGALLIAVSKPRPEILRGLGSILVLSPGVLLIVYFGETILTWIWKMF